MTLTLMAKAFKLNYSTPTNNNQRILSNLRNWQIAQPGMNMGQDRQMQMVGGNGGNQFRQYAGQNAGNLTGYNDVQNIGNQVIQNALQNLRVQNVRNQNGLIGVTNTGFESRPPMLNKENYVPWSSRLLWYAKSRPNGKLIHNFIINGSYVRRMIPEPDRADDQAIQTILLGLPEDIYAAIDSCESAQEIWESIESYYHRFLKLMNDMKRNKHFPEKIAMLNQDQPSFNQNYMQQPMPNPEDIIDPTTAMHMALALMAKAFKLNYSTLINNNQRISSNPHNRQIAQPGMNMGQDRQMQIGEGNGENKFRQYAGQNVGNLNGYNAVQNVDNQNLNGNGNLVAAHAKGNAAGHNENQIRCYNCRGVGYFARNSEEFDIMAAAADLDEIEEVNANCVLMANLQQASTSGTQTDKAPVYDSDGSAEVHDYENCDDNEIFNMFTQEEQYTKLVNPIPEPHQVPQNDNNVIYEVTSVEQSGETVEQHPVNVEETRALYDSLY
nr:hypothetical protein [Tanacetum cinerariifolium]